MIEFVKNHYNDLLAIVGAAVSLATLVVKLTPSQADDTILAKIVAVLDHLSVVNPKK
jgi:hypothetical protein